MRICITGDILYSNPINELCKTETGYDFKQCLDAALPYLQGCDYVIVNPETPFSGEEFGYTAERYCFNTPTEALAQLKDIGVDLVTLANNHAMDRDYRGLLATIQNCEKVGIDYIGVSARERNGVILKDFGEITVGFVNATYGTNAFHHKHFLPADKKLSAIALVQPEEDMEGAMHLLCSNDQIAEETERLYGNGNPFAEPYLEALANDIAFAKAHADFTVMLLHSGGQYNVDVERYTQMLCDNIKVMGADMIVVNHPHIIIPSTFDDNGIFTAYCLGNLQYACPYDPNISQVNYEYSVLLYLTFEDKMSYPKLSFSVMRCVCDEAIPPKVYNAYDYFRLTGDKETETEMLRMANRFAPFMNFTSAAREYEITRVPV